VAITFTGNHAITGGGAGSATFPNPNVVGDLLVIIVQSSVAIPTPTDTAGNTWVDCGAGNVFNSFGGGTYYAVYYVANCKAQSSNAVSVTGSFEMEIMEFSGVSTSAPVDSFASQNAGSSGSGSNNCSAGTLNTTYADLLVVGGIANGAVTAGTNVAWTDPDAGVGFVKQYFIQTSSGSIVGNFTDAAQGGDPYIGIIVAFMPPLPPSPIYMLVHS
jgi:hypothetical protein